MEQSLLITKAGKEDSAAIIRLINEAYRGEPVKKGWTSEGAFLEGERITESGMKDLLNREDTDNFKCTNDNGDIVGFVSLQKRESFIYLSFLTVSPEAQATGIGRQLLAFGETYALANHKPSILITVVNIRHELIAWYERRGYQLTGRVFPFPAQGGKPNQPINLVEMKKMPVKK